jgi:hypothetical protein
MASFIPEDNSISEKKALMEKIKYLLNSTCNTPQNCKTLLNDIENTKNECNKLFRPPPGNPDYNYEKGAFIRNTACSDLTILQKKISELKGGKSNMKKSKSKKSKSKRKKSKKNKSRSKRRKTLRR